MFRALTLCVSIAVTTCAVDALGFRATDLPVLEAGDLRISSAAGPVSVDRDWHFGAKSTLRVGIGGGVELAGPFALGVRLIDVGPGSAVYLGAGVADLFFAAGGGVLWSPAVVLAGQARLGPEAALRIAFDFTGVEQGYARGDHPAWFRSALGLIVDVGPWVTVSFGVAFQRRAFGDDPPSDADRTGWVGDARFSIGAVRSQPFTDLPTLAIHLTEQINVVGLFRFDVNTHTDTTDSRFLVGFEIEN